MCLHSLYKRLRIREQKSKQIENLSWFINFIFLLQGLDASITDICIVIVDKYQDLFTLTVADVHNNPQILAMPIKPQLTFCNPHTSRLGDWVKRVHELWMFVFFTQPSFR